LLLFFFDFFRRLLGLELVFHILVGGFRQLGFDRLLGWMMHLLPFEISMRMHGRMRLGRQRHAKVL